MEMVKPRVLVVDDDPSWRELLTEAIGELSEPCDVTQASSYPEAEALLDSRHFHVAFVDLRLREDSRDLEGKLLVQKIVGQDEGTSVVIATAHADVNTAIVALKQWHVLDFLLKDEWNPDKVAELVAKGTATARHEYGRRYESAVEVLAGGAKPANWLVELLGLLSAEGRAVSGADRRASSLLNELMDGLYPLLPPQGRPAMGIDESEGRAAAIFWSKAIGAPVAVDVGPSGKIDAAPHSVSGFGLLYRYVEDDVLGLAGAVYVPAVPAFTSFERK